MTRDQVIETHVRQVKAGSRNTSVDAITREELNRLYVHMQRTFDAAKILVEKGTPETQFEAGHVMRELDARLSGLAVTLAMLDV
jgi:hypothetical protein